MTIYCAIHFQFNHIPWKMLTYYHSYRLVHPRLSSATLLSPCIEAVDANSTNVQCGFLCISELSDGCSSLTMMKHSVNKITKIKLFRNTEYCHLHRVLWLRCFSSRMRQCCVIGLWVDRPFLELLCLKCSYVYKHRSNSPQSGDIIWHHYPGWISCGG